MSNPWTPGPWSYHRNVAYWQFDAEGVGQIGDVCAIGTMHNENHPSFTRTPAEADALAKANARLIAAAPEMAEALTELIDEWFDAQTMADDPFWGKARALLARIRGEAA